jgi:hypothetical protein
METQPLQAQPMTASAGLLEQARATARLVHAPRTASHLGAERLLREHAAFLAAREQGFRAGRRISHTVVDDVDEVAQ